MKTITECESKHCKAWPLLSLVCAGVIAIFMAGCAEAPTASPEYHSSSRSYPPRIGETVTQIGNPGPYYPTGILAARGAIAIQQSVPGWGYGVGAGVRQPSP